jgi:hypothetical protein
MTATTTLLRQSAAVDRPRWELWRRLATRVVTSPQWMLLVCWYFALLLISAVSKYATSGWGDFRRTAHAGQAGWLPNLQHLIEVLPRVFRVYRADVLETLFIILPLVVVGHIVARIRLSVLAWVSLSIATLIAFASWTAQSQTGVPLTYSTLMISLRWGAQHPGVIPAVMPLSTIAFVVLLALVYGGVPAAFASPWLRKGWRAPLVSNVCLVLGASAVSLLALAFATPGPLVPSMSQTMSPAEGFWSSTIVALADVDRESPVNLGRPGRASVLEKYRKIAYPLGRAAQPNPIASLSGSRIPQFCRDAQELATALRPDR